LGMLLLFFVTCFMITAAVVFVIVAVVRLRPFVLLIDRVILVDIKSFKLSRKCLILLWVYVL